MDLSETAMCNLGKVILMINKKIVIFLSLLCMIGVPAYASTPVSIQAQTVSKKSIKEKKKTKKSESTTQEKNISETTTQGLETNTEEEIKNPSSFSFTVYLDADITLSENDIFKITLKDSLGQLHTVEMNAYESSNAVIENELEEGIYTVNSIEYNGMNSVITQDGYGIPVQFTLSSKQSTEIPFYIGKQQTELSGLFVIKNGMSIQTTQSNEQTSSTEPVQNNKEASNTADMTTASDVTTNTAAQPDKKDVVEVVKSKTKKRNSQYIPFSPTKLVPIGIVAVIGMVAILLYYRKNYKI